MSHKLTIIGTGVVGGLAVMAGLAGLATVTVRVPAQAAVEPAIASRPHLASAGALAFGPAGILFAGDSMGAAIFAIDTGDTKAPAGPVAINVQGLDTKIAALV